MSRSNKKLRGIAPGVLCGLAVVTLAAGFDARAATASSSLSAPPVSLAESHEISLRAQLGLQRDLAYVRNIDAAASSSRTDLGIPLTPAEQADMAGRGRLGNAITAIDKTFKTADPTYVGAWLDQASGGILNVLYTAKPGAEAAARLQALLPPGGSARVAVVPNSLATLTAVQAKVTDEMVRDQQNSDQTIVASAVDLSTNSIAITLLESSPSGEEAALLARYGPTLTFIRGEQAVPAGVRDIRSGRVYGGEWIRGGNGKSCTIGYEDAKSTTNETYGINAGHCAPNGTTFAQGLVNPQDNGARIIGAVHSNSTTGRSSTNCDCAPVGPTPIGGYGTNQVFVNNNALFTYTNTGTAYQGESVCHTGAASYEDPSWGASRYIQCGVVRSSSASFTYPAPYSYAITDAVAVQVHSQLGDSGAAFGDGGSFLGIVSGANTTYTYFSKATNFGTAGLTLSYAS